MRSKKATGEVIGLIVGVGIAVLVVVFLGVMLGSTYELVEDDISAIGNNVVIQDTFTADNDTAVRLDHSFVQTGTLTVSNVSGSVPIALGNFTIDYDAGTLLLTNDAYDNWAMTANYTWGANEVRDNIGEASIAGFNAFNKTGSYLPIIVLALVIGFVLTIVLGFMTFGGRNGGTL